ncbi:MAG: zinc ribbon domain-containing protein [Clostridia bacterium]|nr:zinc ribbon domain-containing protein [Clostridia bacterium]
MSLINCPECNKEISDKAYSCPNCGYPIATSQKQEFLKEIESIKREAAAEVLCNEQTEKPKKHRKHIFVRIVLSFVVIISLLGIAFVSFYFLDPLDLFGNIDYEQIAIDCIKYDLRKSVEDRTSLNLTENPRILLYRSLNAKEQSYVSYFDEKNVAWLCFIEVSYSSTNAYGARSEDVLYYYVEDLDDENGISIYKVCSEEDLFNRENYFNYSLFKKFLDCNENASNYVINPDEEIILNGKRIAKKTYCGYTP